MTHTAFLSNEEETSATLLLKLTRREWDVMLRLARGLTTVQIAEEIYVEPKSVENYRTRIAAKLGLKGRHRLMWYSWKNREVLEQYHSVFQANRNV
jgi:DNA-binding NarL/FixJ family response regulator